MALGEYLGAGPNTTKLLLHLNGDANDSSGNGNNGTDSNVSWVAGKFGNAGSFNGSSSKIVIPSVDMNNITVSYWVKLTNLPSGNNYGGISCGGYDINKGFELLIHKGSNTYAGPVAYVRGGTTQCYDGDAPYTLRTGIRYNVMMTRDGNIINTYIDGILITTKTYAGAGNIDIGGHGINIGTRTSGNNYIRWVDGLIDEVIIENRAWTPEQIKKYYTYTKGRFGII